MANSVKSSTGKRTRSMSSTSSSVISPEYKRPNISSTSFDEELDEFENLLLCDNPSPKTYIDRNFDALVRETIMSEPITAYINAMIKTELKKQALQYEERISFLTGSVDSLTTMVAELRNELDKQQQYSRRASLRIVNDWREERGEDTDEKVVEMARTQLNLNIDKSDIDRSHRVGKPHPRGKPRPIIVKFVSYRTKKAPSQH